MPKNFTPGDKVTVKKVDDKKDIKGTSYRGPVRGWPVLTNP